MAGHRRAGVLGQERGHGVLPELPSDDRCSLEHRTLGRPETVETSGEDSLDGRGERDPLADPSLLGEHGEHLLEEERVPFGRLDDSFPCLIRQGGFTDEVLDERSRLLA